MRTSGFGLRTSSGCRIAGFGRLLLPAAALLALAVGEACGQQTNTLALGSGLPDAGWSLLRVVGALALVLALFFGGVWLFRNWQRLAAGRGVEPKLRVLEVRPLGNRQALYVIAYEQQRFLVACSPAGVSLLTPLPQADPRVEPAPVALPSFGQALGRLLAEKS